MSRSWTLDGQSGTIPYDEYFRKIQQHHQYEDPQATENYIRKQLVDFRPDEPFLESDMPRDPNDRGGGTHSREVLSLRHSGARTEEEPYLPDGTFLDHEFMERDPRGVSNEPDMNKAREQRMARGVFLKMYNDDDLSVPETGINPVQMNALIRGAQQQFKDRYQNFEESMDSWHNGGAVPAKRSSTVALVTTDGTIINLTEASQRNRRDLVSALSDSGVGAMRRYTEPDHRIKISRYGETRPMFEIGSNKWNNNRYNSYLDHQTPIELQGQMVNRMLANLILDIQGQRDTKQVVAQGTSYGDSEVNQLRDGKRKINPDDIFKIIQIGMSSNTQIMNPVIDGVRDNRPAPNQVLDVKAAQLSAKLNHEILHSMTQSNRKLGPKEAKDLRNKIKTSAADNGIYHELNARHSVSKAKERLARETLDTRHIEEERGIRNYSGIKPATDRKTHERTSFEKNNNHSLETQRRLHGLNRTKNRSTNDAVNDIDMDEFRDADARYVREADRGGRMIQSTRGDIHMGDSTSGVDIQQSLQQMILQ